jgi:type 1 glutamine amidotransferase
MRARFPGLLMRGILFSAALGAQAQGDPAFRVLYYNKSPAGAAYVHTSAIAAMKDSILSWGRAFGFSVDVAADASVMNAANLAKYRTVVFDNVSSETADAFPQASQRQALLDYMKTGGFVGIHAAAEAGRWPDLVSLLGAKMTIHTSETNELTATLNADAGAAGHPIFAGAAPQLALPSKASLVDEWYSYTTSPRNVAGVKILYTLDEKTFVPAQVMGDHPIAWIRDMPGGGRMFYTGMGHSAPYLAQPFMRSLLINAIFWSAGKAATGLAGGGGPEGIDASVPGIAVAIPGAGRLTVRGPAGAYAVVVRDLAGAVVARARRANGAPAEFGGLRPGAYAIIVASGAGRWSRLAAVR